MFKDIGYILLIIEFSLYMEQYCPDLMAMVIEIVSARRFAVLCLTSSGLVSQAARSHCLEFLRVIVLYTVITLDHLDGYRYLRFAELV